ncbi:MAG TPA: YfhO family protein [Terriglobales bacterium]|nr:YfhO family protein [Terriglobales bacterium]
MRERGAVLPQAAWALGLSLFAGAFFAAPLLARASLYWDWLRLYSFYRDIFHALGRFGEIPWWNPALGDGLPFYYIALLGVNTTTPVFAAMAAAVWAAGRLGLHPASFHALYVVYFAVLVPALVAVAFWALARQVFERARTVYFVTALAAFSPGAVLTLSDMGLEHTAYALFVAGALLAFVRRPAGRTFATLALALVAFAVGANHLALYWSAVFVPLFAVVVLAVRAPGEASAREAFRAVPPLAWAALAAGCLVAVLPALVTFAQGADLVRASSGTRVYSYGFLRPGSPLELLAAGTPDVGFENVGRVWQPVTAATSPTGHMGYGYLGVLTLPLAFVGLVLSRSVWRPRLLVMLGVCATIVLLSAWSPLFSLVLAWPTPLRAVNHFGDSAFRFGLYGLVILAAGLGFEAALTTRAGRRLAVRALGVSVVGASALYVALHGSAALTRPLFGFMLAMAVLALVLLGGARSAGPTGAARLAGLLVALAVVDTSTVAWGHVRNVVMPGAVGPLSEPPGSAIGMNADVRSLYARELIASRRAQQARAAGVDLGALPEAAFHGGAVRASDARTLEALRAGRTSTLLLTGTDASAAAAPGALPAGTAGSAATVRTIRATYNTRELRVDAPREGFLFLRLPYSPYWRAEVNGAPRPIERAFFAFSAIPVPAGDSRVALRFAPPAVAAALVAAYGVLALLAAAWLVLRVGPRGFRAAGIPGGVPRVP